MSTEQGARDLKPRKPSRPQWKPCGLWPRTKVFSVGLFYVLSVDVLDSFYFFSLGRWRVMGRRSPRQPFLLKTGGAYSSRWGVWHTGQGVCGKRVKGEVDNLFGGRLNVPPSPINLLLRIMFLGCFPSDKVIQNPRGIIHNQHNHAAADIIMQACATTPSICSNEEIIPHVPLCSRV